MDLAKCLKLVSTFYSILALGGGATAGLGIWSNMNGQASDFLKELDDPRLTALLSVGPRTLIALGFTLAFMGLVGCLGVLKRRSWMILVFFCVVLIILIAQVAVSVFLVLPDSMKVKALSSLEKTIVESLQMDESSILKKAMNQIVALVVSLKVYRWLRSVPDLPHP